MAGANVLRKRSAGVVCSRPVRGLSCPGIRNLLGRAGGTGDSSILFSFGLFLKVTGGNFYNPDTAGTRRRLLRQLPYCG